MPTFDARSGKAAQITSVKNPDGSYTYSAVITGLTLDWDGHSCDVMATFSVSAPAEMDTPAHGNLFRFAEQGAYDVRVHGTDFG